MLRFRREIEISKSFLFIFRSLSSSSASSPRTEFHNYYLRKRRKWPHPVFRARWEEKLSQQDAMQALRQQTRSSSPENLLSCLINSFALYNCDPTPDSYRFLIKTLIKTSQVQYIQPVLDRIEKVEKFETPESIFIDLIEFYGERNRYQEAIDVFFKIPNFRCNPSVDSLNCLLFVLCKEKEGLGIVPQVLLKSRLMNIRLEESSFCILIKALCRVKKPKNAMDLLYHMYDHDIEIDEDSFSLILLSLCKQQDLECNEVMRLMEEMKKLGFNLKRKDWGNVVRFLLKKGKKMEALEALRKMKLDGYKPDVNCYTMVMDGLISEGHYENVEQLFDEMLILGVIPDINTYNVYVNGLCKQNKFDDGIRMLSCMEEIGCKPNMVTYNTLLSAMYEKAESGKAREFLKYVREKGVLIHSRTYDVMIAKMISEGEISEALRLLEEMVDRSLVPQPSTLDEILCWLCQKGSVSKAVELLTNLLGKNIVPGERAWKALIVGSGVDNGFTEIPFSPFPENY